MSGFEMKESSAAGLGVAIVVRDSTRLAFIRDLVLEAGHSVVAPAAADVFLVDEQDLADLAAERPALVLGGRDQGQAGWLPASSNAHQIDAALRAVAAGLRVRAVNEVKEGGFEELPEHGHGLLTPRELDVLAAIGAGFSNKAIARQLGISLHTVKFHIESLLRKLGARTRAEAVAKALEQRIRETVHF
jgi:two-component system nitrate/nitrite response regulator NarL